MFRSDFRPSSSTVQLDILNCPWTCQHTNYIPLFTVTFISNSRYTAIYAERKPKFCAIVFYNIYCYNNYQTCSLQLHIVLLIYTATLYHYVTIHYKYSYFTEIYSYGYICICSVRPFFSLFPSLLYIPHHSKFFCDGLVFSFLQVSS
jgi:hypothetical protein